MFREDVPLTHNLGAMFSPATHPAFDTYGHGYLLSDRHCENKVPLFSTFWKADQQGNNGDLLCVRNTLLGLQEALKYGVLCPLHLLQTLASLCPTLHPLTGTRACYHTFATRTLGSCAILQGPFHSLARALSQKEENSCFRHFPLRRTSTS